MEDEKIFKVSLFIALIGLVGMMISAGTIKAREVRIAEINKGMIDEEVIINGFVEETKESKSGKVTFLELNDGTGKITAVIFESTKNEIEKSGLNPGILEGRKIKVTGKLTEYRGSMEIIIEKPGNLKIIR